MSCSIYLSRSDLEELLARLIEHSEEPLLIEGSDFAGVETLYLSRRNAATLLSKLHRRENGEETACLLIKNDTTHATYPCSTQFYVHAVLDQDIMTPTAENGGIHTQPSVRVIAIRDALYYADREPGQVHPLDEPQE